MPSCRVRPGVGSAVPRPGAMRLEQRVEPLHDLGLPADHEAEAALQPEHPAARPDVDVVDVLRRELLGPGDVVAVVGVAAVDHHVTGLQQRDELARASSRPRPRAA